MSAIRQPCGDWGICQHVQSLLNIITISLAQRSYIEDGGELFINGGVITNADVENSVNGKLTIDNGGKLVLRTNTSFEATLGSNVDIKHGEILSSADF